MMHLKSCFLLVEPIAFLPFSLTSPSSLLKLPNRSSNSRVNSSTANTTLNTSVISLNPWSDILVATATTFYKTQAKQDQQQVCLVMSKLTFVFPVSKRNIPFIPYRLSVRVVSSERAGCGKSLVVQRLRERLVQLGDNDAVLSYLRDGEADVPLCISVPIYGPAVDQCSVVESLLPHIIVPDLPLSRIFHLDVHPSVLNVFF